MKKFKSCYMHGVFSLGLCGVVALGAITLMGLSIWIASVTAQDAASLPLNPLPQQPTRSTYDVPSNAVQLPAAPSQISPAQPVHVPPGVVYPSYQTLPTAGASGYPIMALPAADAKTLELTKEYQTQQNEIGRLVKEFGAAKSERDKESLRDEIVKATTKQFDLRQQVRGREIEQLKERLAEVEKTVKERNAVKDKIVAKRVAEILREPDLLRWDSLNIVPAPPVAVIRPAPSSFAPPGAVPTHGIDYQSQTKSYVPKTVTSIKSEVVVDEDGIATVVETPFQQTVYVETNGLPTYGPYSDSLSPDGVTVNRSAAGAADGRYRLPTVASLSVAEAQAGVEIAEGKYQQLASRGGNINDAELKTLKAELELARLLHARAKTEFEGNAKILELNVRHAELVHSQAIAVLRETQEINKRSPNAIPPTQVSARTAAVEQSRIELERAKTILEIHQQSNAPQEKLPGPELNRE